MSSDLRILIVDDSDVTRRILGAIVRSRHWNPCGEAEDGWSGVKLELPECANACDCPRVRCPSIPTAKGPRCGRHFPCAKNPPDERRN